MSVQPKSMPPASEFLMPFPVLVCDVGGTNARFAGQATPEARLSEVVHLKTGDYPSLVEAAEAAIPRLGERPRSLVVCGAGPVDGRKLKLTNAPWLIDGPETARRLGLAQGLLFNDFEAQALSLPAIPRDWARPIGPALFGPRGPQVILGPGTGLGIGALVEASGRHTPLASEACHIDFGPVGDEEAALWPHLERVYGRVTTESVMSGPGLARVNAARVASLSLPKSTLDAPGVVAAALADRAGEEAAKPEIVLGIAIALGLRRRHGGRLRRHGRRDAGGRGAGQRIVHDFLDDVTFRHAFEAKAPVDGLARRIPTRLVTRADSVLVGMAAIAATPHLYAIDVIGRAWV